MLLEGVGLARHGVARFANLFQRAGLGDQEIVRHLVRVLENDFDGPASLHRERESVEAQFLGDGDDPNRLNDKILEGTARPFGLIGRQQGGQLLPKRDRIPETLLIALLFGRSGGIVQQAVNQRAGLFGGPVLLGKGGHHSDGVVAKLAVLDNFRQQPKHLAGVVFHVTHCADGSSPDAIGQSFVAARREGLRRAIDERADLRVERVPLRRFRHQWDCFQEVDKTPARLRGKRPGLRCVPVRADQGRERTPANCLCAGMLSELFDLGAGGLQFRRIPFA